MSADANLTEILAAARRELPDVPDEHWRQIEAYLRLKYGTQRVYIEAHKKRRHLVALERAGDDVDANRLAEILGVSVRQARRLRGLR